MEWGDSARQKPRLLSPLRGLDPAGWGKGGVWSIAPSLTCVARTPPFFGGGLGEPHCSLTPATQYCAEAGRVTFEPPPKLLITGLTREIRRGGYTSLQ